MNNVEAKCISVVNWRDVVAKAQFEKVDKFLANWAEQSNKAAQMVVQIENLKADKSQMNELESKSMAKFDDLDKKISSFRDDQLTLEHYTERYVPIQIQNMIVSNLEKILSK